MITMIDQIYDRDFQAHRTELSRAVAGGLARVGHAVSNAFEVLNRIEYSAPWASKPAKHGRISPKRGAG
jgi:hypothetical protein